MPGRHPLVPRLDRERDPGLAMPCGLQLLSGGPQTFCPDSKPPPVNTGGQQPVGEDDCPPPPGIPAILWTVTNRVGLVTSTDEQPQGGMSSLSTANDVNRGGPHRSLPSASRMSL